MRRSGLLFLVFVLTMTTTLCQPQEEENPLMGKNVLIVWGGWNGHSPESYANRMLNWAQEEGANVIVSDSLGIYKDSLLMEKQDLILQYWTMGTIKPEEEKGLLQAIRSGVGFAGCHGGIGDSFRNNTNYQYMVGGQWVAHPGGIIDYSVDVVSDDPIVSGIESFDVHTEQYYMLVDPNVNVLATTEFTGEYDSWIDGAVIPVVWKKYFGEGRVFYSSLGHKPDDFDVSETWTILTRGIKWAAQSKYSEKEGWLNAKYK